MGRGLFLFFVFEIKGGWVSLACLLFFHGNFSTECFPKRFLFCFSWNLFSKKFFEVVFMEMFQLNLFQKGFWSGFHGNVSTESFPQSFLFCFHGSSSAEVFQNTFGFYMEISNRIPSKKFFAWKVVQCFAIML
jgi:hypothetical protein